MNTAPPMALVDSLLLKMSANAAARALTEAGYAASRSALETRVTQLVAEGRRQRFASTGGVAPDRTDVHGHLDGCAALHESTIALFKRLAAQERVEVKAVAGWLHGHVDGHRVAA